MPVKPYREWLREHRGAGGDYVDAATYAAQLGVSIEELASPRGLGDTIAQITHATGLDKLAEAYTQITGKPCGCASRQDALNKLFPYGVKENG